MIEKIKTYLLIALVGLSVMLTWQIMTYQPHYDYLLPTEYVAHEGLAERREIHDLIRPENILYHYGDQRHTISDPDKYEYTSVIQKQMKNWYFYNFIEIGDNQIKQWDSLRKRYEGIELSFSTNLPFSVFRDLFTINVQDDAFTAAESVYLYINPITEEVYAMFLNYDLQKMIRANTSVTVSELRQYLSLGENLATYEAVVDEESDALLKRVLYLSTESLEMTEYRYFYQKIFVDQMISYLFVDPTLVREIQDRAGEIFYTDGTRGIQLNRSQTIMYYVHPLAERSSEDGMANQTIQRSIQFVNQHKGWGPHFYLHQVQQPFSNETVVQFRRYMNRYPVFSANPDEEQNVIQLDVLDGRVVGYDRTLVDVDRVMNQINRKMPAATEVIEAFGAANIPVTEISKLYLGYVSQYAEYYVSFVPHWVVEWKSGEQDFIRQLEDISLLNDGQQSEKEEESDELE